MSTMTLKEAAHKLRLHAEFQASLGGAGELLGPLDILLVADAIDAHLTSREAKGDAVAWIDHTDSGVFLRTLGACRALEDLPHGTKLYTHCAPQQAAQPAEQPRGEAMAMAWLYRSPAEIEFNKDPSITRDAELVRLMREAGDHEIIPLAPVDQPKPEQARANTVYAVAADGVSESGHQLYTLHDESVPMADNWRLVDSSAKPEQAAGDGVDSFGVMREVIELMQKSGGWWSGKATVSMPRKRAFQIITLLHDAIERTNTPRPAVATAGDGVAGERAASLVARWTSRCWPTQFVTDAEYKAHVDAMDFCARELSEAAALASRPVEAAQERTRWCPDIGEECLRRVSWHMNRLGISTPVSIEEFVAKLESELFAMCRGLDSLWASINAKPAPEVDRG